MFLAVFRFMFFQSEGLYFLSNVILLIQQMSPCGLKVACLKVAYFWGKSVVLHKHRQVFYTLEREFQSEGSYFLSNVILLIQQMSPCGLKVSCLKVFTVSYPRRAGRKLHKLDRLAYVFVYRCQGVQTRAQSQLLPSKQTRHYRCIQQTVQTLSGQDRANLNLLVNRSHLCYMLSFLC